ncbi:MAG: chemotaxis protein CheB [Planctomycetes bacterium]|nr:chemotaxis protein CheB [Planctomycetota bacterium]
MKSIVLATPDGAVRERIASILSAHEVRLLTTASSLRTCLMKVEGYSPDICLLDTHLLRSEALPSDARQRTRWIGFGNKTAHTLDSWIEHVDLALEVDDETLSATLSRIIGSELRSLPKATPQVCAPVSSTHCVPTDILAVGIGVSTGGPQALREVLSEIPHDFPLPILVAQHIPKDFSKSLAASLDQVCKLGVAEALDRERIVPGRVYIAPGGRQLRVAGNADIPTTHLSDETPANGCRPSVNTLFSSMLSVFGHNIIAVVMTGMGDDGLEACVEIHGAGGHVIAQEASSCTVYGMPRAIVENRIASQIVGLTEMARAICASVRT